MSRLLTFEFGQWAWLLLLALVPLLAFLQARTGRPAALPYPAVSLLRRIGAPSRSRAGRWMRFLHLLALVLMVLALARPRFERGESDDHREGIDIVLCTDISGSMDERDFEQAGKKISRLEALVTVIDDFVDQRPNDRFGMIGFAEHTYRLSPLTLDGEWIKGMLREIATQGGTAMGDGILGSLELLKESTGKSRVIILVTDGESNAGASPLKAAEEARKAGVRVHTVEIISLQKVSANRAVKSVLSEVANITGGLYFQAANLNRMREVYAQIDRMEKTRLDQRKTRLYDEIYLWLVIPAFLLLLIRWMGGHTLWLKIP